MYAEIHIFTPKMLIEALSNAEDMSGVRETGTRPLCSGLVTTKSSAYRYMSMDNGKT